MNQSALTCVLQNRAERMPWAGIIQQPWGRGKAEAELEGTGTFRQWEAGRINHLRNQREGLQLAAQEGVKWGLGTHGRVPYHWPWWAFGTCIPRKMMTRYVSFKGRMQVSSGF